MNYYGISAIHWNANLGELDEVLLHKFVRHERDGALVIRHGEPASCADVVGLIRGGDMVWVLLAVAPRSDKNTDRVGVKRGRSAYLYSCTMDGTPTPALAELPRYQKPNEPPPTAPGVGRSVDRARPS